MWAAAAYASRAARCSRTGSARPNLAAWLASAPRIVVASKGDARGHRCANGTPSNMSSAPMRTIGSGSVKPFRAKLMFEGARREPSSRAQSQAPGGPRLSRQAALPHPPGRSTLHDQNTPVWSPFALHVLTAQTHSRLARLIVERLGSREKPGVAIGRNPGMPARNVASEPKAAAARIV